MLLNWGVLNNHLRRLSVIIQRREMSGLLVHVEYYVGDLPNWLMAQAFTVFELWELSCIPFQPEPSYSDFSLCSTSTICLLLIGEWRASLQCFKIFHTFVCYMTASSVHTQLDPSVLSQQILTLRSAFQKSLVTFLLLRGMWSSSGGTHTSTVISNYKTIVSIPESKDFPSFHYYNPPLTISGTQQMINKYLLNEYT